MHGRSDGAKEIFIVSHGRLAGSKMKDYEPYRPLFTDGHLLYDQCQQPTALVTFFHLISIIVTSQCNRSEIKSVSCPRVEPFKSSEEIDRLEDEYDFIVVGGGVAGKLLSL